MSVCLSIILSLPLLFSFNIYLLLIFIYLFIQWRIQGANRVASTSLHFVIFYFFYLWVVFVFVCMFLVSGLFIIHWRIQGRIGWLATPPYLWGFCLFCFCDFVDRFLWGFVFVVFVCFCLYVFLFRGGGGGCCHFFFSFSLTIISNILN